LRCALRSGRLLGRYKQALISMLPAIPADWQLPPQSASLQQNGVQAAFTQVSPCWQKGPFVASQAAPGPASFGGGKQWN